MRVLLTNDDGHHAAGLAALWDAFTAADHEVWSVAPALNQSGCSNALTLAKTLTATELAPRRFMVDGTPADCVQLACGELLPEVPDIVVSGINRGPNLGDDCLYSGTVGGAMEGRFLRLPAVAASACDWAPGHYADAARIVVEFVAALQHQQWPAATLFNLNVPDRGYAELGKPVVTRLGRRGPPAAIESAENPRGRREFWLGAAGQPVDAAPDTDFAMVASGRISVTPLQIDLTAHDLLDATRAILA